MTALQTWALLILQSASEPDYPLGKLRFPSMVQASSSLTLTDFRYRVTQEDETRQAFEARVRLGTWGFVGGEVIDQRRGLFFDTYRVELGITEEEGRYQVEAAHRAHWWLVRTRAERRPQGEGRSWLVDASGALRLSPDFEFLIDWREDTEPGRADLGGRDTRRRDAGFLYQRNHNLEWSARAGIARELTEGGVEQDRTRVETDFLYLRSRVELTTGWAYQRVSGRLARRQGAGRFQLRGELFPRLVAGMGFSGSWERGLKLFQRELRGGLTFFARRHHFERSGEAAQATLGLARLAHAEGGNERRRHDLEGRRALRERLALSPWRRELAPAIESLYRAQVAERLVPQVGFEIASELDDVQGLSARTIHVFLSVPWRPTWPFRRREDAVPFVRLDYRHREERFSSLFASVSLDLAVQVAFNRELGLLFTWERPGRTPLEIALLQSRPDRFALECLYAFGQ